MTLPWVTLPPCCGLLHHPAVGHLTTLPWVVMSPSAGCIMIAGQIFVAVKKSYIPCHFILNHYFC